MNKEYWDFSGKIDPRLTRILELVAEVASGASAKVMVIGATARDIVLLHHGLRSPRGTKDVDFGIAVENWTQFEQFKGALIANHDFSSGSDEHRVIHKAASVLVSMHMPIICSCKTPLKHIGCSSASKCHQHQNLIASSMITAFVRGTKLKRFLIRYLPSSFSKQFGINDSQHFLR